MAAALAVAAPSSAEKKPRKSGATGKVVMKSTGEPVENAYIYAYEGKPALRARMLGIVGITDWVSHGSDADGTYRLNLPPGEYFIVARKRQNGLNFGPLYSGDLYDHTDAGKAIKIRKGKFAECNFELNVLKEPMFFQGLTAAEKVTDTGVRGKLLNEDGEHVPGTYVIAYSNDDMQRLPDFASTLTDDEGNYTLFLPEGGRYWLAARFYAMKVPQEGEPFARYEGSNDHSVEVKSGEFLDGIDMILEPYDGTPPEGYKPVH
jgi:hypothetical protein